MTTDLPLQINGLSIANLNSVNSSRIWKMGHDYQCRRTQKIIIGSSNLNPFLQEINLNLGVNRTEWNCSRNALNTKKLEIKKSTEKKDNRSLGLGKNSLLVCSVGSVYVEQEIRHIKYFRAKNLKTITSKMYGDYE